MLLVAGKRVYIYQFLTLHALAVPVLNYLDLWADRHNVHLLAL